MKIININADKERAQKVIEYFDFINNIIAPLRTRLKEFDKINLLEGGHEDNNRQLPKVRYFEVFDHANVANLIHTIPIFLYKSKPEHKAGDVVKISIDTPLGAYISNPEDEPKIELYMDALEENSKIRGVINEERFKYMFVLVLIHELGHAALDVNNCSWYATPFDNITYTDEIEYNSDLTAKQYEEGMANAIAYKIITQSRKTRFENFVKNFIENQGDGYDKGVDLEKYLEDNISDFTSWKVGCINEIQEQNNKK